MRDEAYGIDKSQHPYPFALALVPHQQLLEIPAYQDIDGIVQGHTLPDAVDGRVYRHAVVRGIVVQNLRQ